MNFIHPNKQLAQEMIGSMQDSIETGHMLEVTLEEILAAHQSWFVSIGQDQDLQGFFCFRRPHEGFAEIGSVRSLKGIFPQIITKFEAERKKEGQGFGCAITKNKAQKFADQTKGKIVPFFDWYTKTKEDKSFILWS